MIGLRALFWGADKEQGSRISPTFDHHENEVVHSPHDAQNEHFVGAEAKIWSISASEEVSEKKNCVAHQDATDICDLRLVELLFDA